MAAGTAGGPTGAEALAPQRSILPRTIAFVRGSAAGASRAPGEEGPGPSPPAPPYYLFPRQSVRELLEASRDSPCQIGRGLRNEGNTCFINCVLQIIVHTAPLQRYFVSKEHTASCTVSTGADGRNAGACCALCLLERHALEALDGSHSALRPTPLLKRIKEIGGRTIRLGRQQDAHEFLLHVFDSMTRAALRPLVDRGESVPHVVQRTSLVHQLFGGYLQSQLLCPECRHETYTFDPFLDLSLEVHKYNTIEKSLEGFTKSEPLCGPNNRIPCKGCKQMVVASKRFQVYKFPPLLALQLKRFEFREAVRAKIGKPVVFRPTLNLAPYSTSPDQEATYRLYAIIVHEGPTAKSGHYFAYVKHANVWHRFDDDNVRVVTEAEVLRQQAYMLFYEMAKLLPSMQLLDAEQEATPTSSSWLPRASDTKSASANGTAAAALAQQQPQREPNTAAVAPGPAVNDIGEPAAANGEVRADLECRSPQQRVCAEPPPSPVLSRQRQRLASMSREARRRTGSDASDAPEPALNGEDASASQANGSATPLEHDQATPVRKKKKRKQEAAEEQAANVQDDVGQPVDAPITPARKKRRKNVEAQSVEDRLQQSTSYATQYGQAQVDTWDGEDEDEVTAMGAASKASFEEAQRRLQPLPERRDEIDAEYDVGKKKHKPRKPKVAFEGKNAFDQLQRQMAAKKSGGGGRGSRKGKGKGKDKGKGKGKDKGKGKGKDKGKGKGKDKGKGKKGKGKGKF